MSTPLIIPVAEYSPDLPDGAGHTETIWNVYPRTPISYGPVNSPVAQYDALPARCRGGATYRNNEGATFIFAGTQNDLFLLEAGLSEWESVSLADGGYDTGFETWRFAHFNNYALATTITENIQKFLLGTDTDFSDLGGSPPRARHIAVVKNAFVVLGNTWDSVNGFLPQRVWWSGAGNAASWPALGTSAAAAVQSNAVDLLGDGGAVQGIAAGLNNADAVIFQEYAVRRMMYSGPPSVFSFSPVESARGCMCPDSIVVEGGIAYYWGNDGIYAFDGGSSRAIGSNKVDKTVFEELNYAYVDRVVGTKDPRNKMIWWAYPTGSSVNGNPDRILMYNWELDRFSLAAITCETILRVLSIGYTLDELYTIFGYTLDTVPAPLDSPIWSGGQLNMGMFNTDHQVCFLTGEPLAATIETNEIQPPPGRRWLVTNSRPIVDGTGTMPSVAIGRRERQEDAVNYTAAVAMNAMGQCPVRTSGRFLRARTTIPAGSRAWRNVSGVELTAVPQGTR